MLRENFSIMKHGVKVTFLLVADAMTLTTCTGLAAAWSHLEPFFHSLDFISVIPQGLATIILAIY